MHTIQLSRQPTLWKRLSYTLPCTLRSFGSKQILHHLRPSDEIVWNTELQGPPARKDFCIKPDPEGRTRYLRGYKAPRMKSSVTILTTPTADTSGTSLVLHFDDRKYLFGNVHEGLQRVCNESGTRMLKLNDIFLTGRTEWRTTGGLLGLLLTIADNMQSSLAGQIQAIEEQQSRWESKRAALVLEQVTKSQTAEQRPKDRKAASAAEEQISKMDAAKQPKEKLELLPKPRTTIHGGDNICQLLATARKFIFRRGMPLDVHENAETISTTTPTFQDANIQVWAMPLKAPTDSVHTIGQATRKRSHDDYLEIPGYDSNEPMTRMETLRGIITDMFDSTWRHDALVEMKLSEVQGTGELFVRDPVTKGLMKFQGPRSGPPGIVDSDLRVLVRKPWPGATRVMLPATKSSGVCMSYIVRNQPTRGKFYPEAARKLGVPPGAAFAALVSGESVTNDKGETITPDQVTAPPRQPAGFAIIELPTVDYLASLKSSAAFTSQETMKGIDAIFWTLGPGVTTSPEFQQLVKERAGTEHIISSIDHCSNYLAMDSAASAQLSHGMIDKERFSIPLHDNTRRDLPRELDHCVIGHRGMELIISPELKLNTEMNPGPLNTLHVVNNMPKSAIKLSQDAQRQIQDQEFQSEYQAQKLQEPETEIITLGTGSAIPSKQRNVSATLIRVPGTGSYLLDCGENTLGQLARLYSPEELKEVLKDLKLIWISHMHADHHLGTVSIIKAWHTAVHGDPGLNKAPAIDSHEIYKNAAKYLVNEQKLCVVSEDAMLSWLQEYSEIEEYGYHRVVPIHVTPTTFDEQDRVSTTTTMNWNKRQLGFKQIDSAINVAMRKATGLADLQAVFVTHCYCARAVSLSWPSGLKISYSGDCRPSKHFATIGKGSTVLIHEATFDDELSGDAIAKKHSTTREAIGVGLEMGAKRIILTHFSQRYSKLPELRSVVARPIRFEDNHGQRNRRTSETAAVPYDMDISGETPAAAMEGPSRPDVESSLDQSLRMSSPTQYLTPSQHEAAKEVRIGVAFDSMRVKIKDIIVLSKYKGAFAKLYADPEHANEEKKAKAAAGEALRRQKQEEKQGRQQRQQANQKLRAGKQNGSRDASIASNSRPGSLMETTTESTINVDAAAGQEKAVASGAA